METPNTYQTLDPKTAGPGQHDIPAAASGILIVDVNQIISNWRALANRVAPAECAAVVKADAYGLGAPVVIPALFEAGVRAFFVATLKEAREALALTNRGARVFVLDGVMPGTEAAVASAGAIPVLSTRQEVEAWAHLDKMDRRSDPEAAPCAIHIDTGLHRLGLHAEDIEALAEAGIFDQLNIVLAMSHMACADEPDHPMNKAQLQAFQERTQFTPATQYSLAASDGLMLGDTYHFDMVRPGYALYGGQACKGQNTPVRPALRAYARVLQVTDAVPGSSVGYSATYTVTEPTRLITISAGYADGMPRSGSAPSGESGAHVAINGQRLPVVGRISMDLMTVDATAVQTPVQRGDFVELIGPHLPLEAVGANAKTIGYEILTRLGRRFHRVYLSDQHKGDV